MAPVYFDELNLVENMHAHYRALGMGYQEYKIFYLKL